MNDSQRTHEIANRIAEARIEEERRNRVQVIPDSKNPVFAFTKQTSVPIRTGIYFDDNRRTASHWKRTPFAGRVIVHNPAPRPGEPKWDAGYGPDVVPEGEGPYKLRMLRGSSMMVGAVIETSAIGYVTAMAEAQQNPHYCRYEPVPDDEPLCGPIISPLFPESLEKARQVYAAETGRDALKADFKTLNAHFVAKEKTPGHMVAK